MADLTVELAKTQVEIILLKQEVAFLRGVLLALLEDRLNELGHFKGIIGKREKLQAMWEESQKKDESSC